MCQSEELTLFNMLSSIHATLQCYTVLATTGAGKEMGRLGPELSCSALQTHTEVNKHRCFNSQSPDGAVVRRMSVGVFHAAVAEVCPVPGSA